MWTEDGVGHKIDKGNDGGWMVLDRMEDGVCKIDMVKEGSLVTLA